MRSSRRRRAPLDPPPSRVLAAWQSARTRVWQRGDARLGALGADDVELTASAAAALQSGVEPAWLAAAELAGRLHGDARARGETQVRLHEVAVGAVLLLLGLLALFVVEPTARAVIEQVRKKRPTRRPSWHGWRWSLR